MTALTIQQAFNLALQHHQAGRLAQAEQLYRQILARQPNHAGALHLLGVAAHQAGRNDIAADLIRQAIALKPNWAEAYSNLGSALYGGGQVDEAITAYRQAITLKPNWPGAHSNLGNTLKARGRLDEAIASYRQAIALNPNGPEAHSNLGNALWKMGQLDEAIACCRVAIALKPDFPEAHHNLGSALKDRGQLDEAIGSYRQAIGLKPNSHKTHNNLGGVLKAKGQLDEAIAAYRQAIACRPNYPEAHSNLAYILHFHPGYDARAIYREHLEWDKQHAEPYRAEQLSHPNDRNPGRRIRIGYLSPDLREHPVGRFLLPLLAHHDKSQVEIFAYAQVPVPDATTRRLRSCVDGWRSIAGLSDAQAADLIRQDRIDILVDLTMHMADNRLLVFARKPAPVQVTYLAYCSTTGMRSMDYRLSDPYLDPIDGAQGGRPGGDESIYSEQTIRLPETYWCYQQPLATPQAGPLPALELDSITFGCLNNFCKVNDGALAAWAILLRAVRNSQLLLHAHEGSHRQRVLERMEREGIEPNRVRFAGKLPVKRYFDLYRQIDIALDTFPYGGGTTTCDALWMGVPVVSLAGNTAVGRGGLSILSNIGLPELAARSEEGYVRLASELARDLPRLDSLRSTLRQRMERSPLMDAPRFARNVESAYRQMWRKWCATVPAGATERAGTTSATFFRP